MAFTTNRLYFANSSLFSTQAKVLASGLMDGLSYVVTDQTIFHPRGGGQPADKGSLVLDGVQYPVTQLKDEEGIIKHFYQGPETDLFKVGTQIGLAIDGEWRTLLARTHSAGHLIEDAVRTIHPELNAYKGFHDPEGASVTFSVSEEELKKFADKKVCETARAAIEQKVNALVQENLPLVQMYSKEKGREVAFGENAACPCGGTHVENSKEVARIDIRYFKKSKADIQIGYKV